MEEICRRKDPPERGSDPEETCWGRGFQTGAWSRAGVPTCAQALLSAKMQAMDPASRGFYEEDGKDLDFYDFEPLPTLPEDEVSWSQKPTYP